MVFICLDSGDSLNSGLWAEAALTFSSSGMVSVAQVSPQLIFNISCFAVPAILSPAAVVGLRPLFALFLREGTGLFTEERMSKSLCQAAAHYIAIFNVITFLVAWSAAFGCCLLEGPHWVMVGLAIAGVVAGLTVTIRLVQVLAELTWTRAILVGLVTFGGGNLPLIIGLPLFWLCR